MFLGSSFGTFGYSRRLHVMPVLHCLGLVAGGWGARVGCFQCLFSSHDGLGISSSTASPLLDSAGRTRNFWVSLLVRSSFGSLFWSGRVRFSLCSLHSAYIVSVAHNFTELNSGRADYGYLAFGELSRFVYCLLQKVKLSRDLPVVEKWEA